jgi:hypothetical protein
MSKNHIEEEIDRLKNELVKKYEEKGCTDEEVLNVSIEIDELLVKFSQFEESLCSIFSSR